VRRYFLLATLHYSDVFAASFLRRRIWLSRRCSYVWDTLIFALRAARCAAVIRLWPFLEASLRFSNDRDAMILAVTSLRRSGLIFAHRFRTLSLRSSGVITAIRSLAIALRFSAGILDAAAFRCSAVNLSFDCLDHARNCSGLLRDWAMRPAELRCSGVFAACTFFTISLRRSGLIFAHRFRTLSLSCSGVPQPTMPSPPSVAFTSLAPLARYEAIQRLSASAHPSPVPDSTTSIKGINPICTSEKTHLVRWYR
jgi:hypothetical protein